MNDFVILGLWSHPWSRSVREPMHSLYSCGLWGQDSFRLAGIDSRSSLEGFSLTEEHYIYIYIHERSDELCTKQSCRNRNSKNVRWNLCVFRWRGWCHCPEQFLSLLCFRLFAQVERSCLSCLDRLPNCVVIGKDSISIRSLTNDMFIISVLGWPHFHVCSCTFCYLFIDSVLVLLTSKHSLLLTLTSTAAA